MSLDFAKTVEVALEGLRQLQPSQITAITVAALTLLIPFWCYRIAALLIREMRQLQQNVLAAFNEVNRTQQEIAKSQQEVAKTTRQLLAQQTDTLNAVHSTHESVLSALPAARTDHQNLSAIRQSRDEQQKQLTPAPTTGPSVKANKNTTRRVRQSP